VLQYLSKIAVTLTGLVLLTVLSVVTWLAWPSFDSVHFLTGTLWNPRASEFGILPMLWGSIVCTTIGTCIALPLGAITSVGCRFLVPKLVAKAILWPIEALASIPSVLFGMLGLMVLAPNFVTLIQPIIGSANETSLIVGGLVLGCMLIPYTTSYCRVAMTQISLEEVNLADALGLHRSYFIRAVVWPKCRAAIATAGLQSWSRGMGEAIALSMIIGRADVTLSESKFMSAGQTLATKLSSPELFLSWETPVHRGAMMSLVLIMLVITVGVSSFPSIIRTLSRSVRPSK
jgi:ABC-type phosphate transport system permease subunit